MDIPKKILIINLGGIGDILLSTPALKALRRHYVDSRISMLVVPRSYELVKDLTFVDEVFIMPSRFSLKSFCLEIFSDLKLLVILRKKHFDLAINMRTLVSKKSAIKIKFLLDIINPKIKAGRNTDGYGRFLDIGIPETSLGQKYESEYDIDTVRALGAEVIDKTIDFEISQESIKKVEALLNEAGIRENDTLIGIHPGGTPSHRWPIENYAKVINEIYEKTSAKFVITGGKEDFGLAKKLILGKNARVLDLTGQLAIQELGALIKKCRLFISNDTGPMHIAAILKTPLVAIFGAGYLTRFDPRSISDKAVVLYKETDCAPCDRLDCDSIKCLKAITPGEVRQAAQALLTI